MRTATAQQWQQAWLPLWPLASDDLLAGVYRMSRHDALHLRYIEANPHALSNLLVVDIDHGDAALRALGTRPLPHVIVENPANGHAHAVWALREPVTRTEYARRKPLAYAAAVTEGLRRAVDGDQGYSGLITKNPLHDAWASMQVTSLDVDRLYSLDQLRDGLGPYMPPPRWREHHKPATTTGLSRNCSIFESARIWAYQEARSIRIGSGNEYATATDSRTLHAAIAAEITARNAEFTEPLPTSETRAMTTSIHKWITTKFRGWTDSASHQRATFTAMQTHRGHKSGAARRTCLEQRLYLL
ncbi:replication initiation protein [Acidipropionibacterium timonense]|uniref:replication initiation protein n=1 Tax=Acidipropionibacterium timonense TaxID=2161818 RepID=UPI001031BD46|nr:replication initiation protein [Acidipropionibacterium timonense]